MEAAKNWCRSVLDSPLTVCVWGAIVLIILVLIYMAVTKQGFLNEFRSAPIASQRSTELLGVGQPIRFASEFSNTSQGGSHVVGESMAAAMARGREHLVGGYETPVFNEIPQILRNNLHDTAGTEDKGAFIGGYEVPDSERIKPFYDRDGNPIREKFGERNMFSEAFDIDTTLKNILHNN